MRMLLFLLVAFGFSISTCQAGSYGENFQFLTVVKTEKLELEIYREKGQCAVRLDSLSKGVLLDIPAPCGFVRASKELKAQTYNYKGAGQVFVIAGPLADQKEYTNDAGVKPKHMCSNLGQVVIIQKGNIKVGPGQNVNLGFCHYLGFDEKDYYGFAFPVD